MQQASVHQIANRQTNTPDSQAKANELIAFLKEWSTSKVNSYLINERRSIPPHLIQDLAGKGFFGLQIPKEYGGLGLSYADTFRVLEQAAAVDPNIMLLLNVHNALGASPLKDYGSEFQKNHILPLLAKGQTFGALAASEPGAGSNVRGLRTEARKTADGRYVINGEKAWISLGAYAGYINLFAQLYDVDGSYLGMTGFVVPQGAAGLRVGDECMTLGMKAIPQNSLRLENVTLTSENLLGSEGQGSQVAQSVFMMGRLLVCINALGGLKRCLQLATRFAKKREIATGNLFENAHTRSVLTDVVQAIKTLEALVYDAAERLDRQESLPSEINIACKVLGAELAFKYIDKCLQMLGARGYMDNNVVGQYFRDFRLARIFEGPTESMTTYLGSVILKKELPFISMLQTQYGYQPSIERFQAQLQSVKIHFKNDMDILCARVGELACWAIVTAINQSKDLKEAAVWAEQNGKNLFQRFINEQPCFSAANLSAEIDLLCLSIGDVEQKGQGENLKLDAFLSRS